MLFADGSDVIVQVPWGGIAGAGAAVGGAIVAAAKILVAYFLRRDEADSDQRAADRTQMAQLRAENLQMFQKVLEIQKETVSAVGALQAEIARSVLHAVKRTDL